MGGQALDLDKDKGEGREQYFNIDPNRVIIDGHDNDAGPESPYWVEDCNAMPDDSFIGDLITNGVMQPVKVKKDGRGSDAPLHVTKGRKRTKGLRAANKILAARGEPLLLLPVIIDKIDDEQVMLQAMSENAQRFELSEIDKARAAHRLIKTHNIDPAKVAASMAEKRATTVSRLRWFDLDRKIQKAVENQQVSFTAACELADLERADQVERFEKLLAEGGTLSTSRLRRAKHEAKVSKGRKSKSTTPYVPPKKTVLRKVGEHGKDYNLNADVIKFAKFVVGANSGSGIAGLTALLRDIEEGKI